MRTPDVPSGGGISRALNGRGRKMETGTPSSTTAGSNDITFACIHCASALVVDVAARGMTLECQRCGKPTPVPDIPKHGTSEPERERKLTDLKQQLRENESQRTEITTYINQLSIQLHRWQLRLQTLNDRKRELETELRKAE